MAQREKEEAELRVPETVTLCATCGFHGSAAGKNMCQSCLTSAALGGASPPTSCCGHEKPRSSPIRAAGRPEDGGKAMAGSEAEGEVVPAATARGAPGRQVNRCAGCRRRVGLTTGFRCRCGELFCAEHRYTDRHVCSYDYKAVGREAIARENPVVRAAKIVRV